MNSHAISQALQITLLGRVNFALGTRPLDGLTLVKARALFAYLAVTQRTHSRQELAGLLWSEVLESSARASLRVTLMRLREAVGDYVASDRQTIGVKPGRPLWVDVHEFAHACSQFQTQSPAVGSREWLHLRQAIHLYQGDFLHDLNVPDAPLFEEWVGQQREHYRRLALEARHRLAVGALEAGVHAQTLEDAHALLRMEPAHEATHRLLMRAYVGQGQTTLALRQYERCEQLLQEELGVPPGRETQLLRDEIMAGKLADVGGISAAAAVDRGAPAQPPSAPRRSRGQPMHGALPLQTTSFVGRQREVAQIQAQLVNPAVRLLTIVGLGGIGKTRLAIEVAQSTGSQFPDGVWFVPLASLTRAALLSSTIANLLALPDYGGTDPDSHLLRHLADKQMLLILDNLEHLLDATDLISRILVAAPRVKILVTSRVRLQLQEEWLLPLQGLDVPAADEVGVLDPALHSAAELFVQRARQLQPDFTNKRANVTHVVRICRLVGGMPLGIELAASWLRSIPLVEIAGELQAGLDVLTTSMRNAPVEHHSMRAVFDRSWQLLGEQEQQTLARLSVFRGGFTRDAAIHVAGATTPGLSNLVDSSWLQLGSNGRYTVHELVCQYAAERLNTIPGEPDRTRQAHSDYFGVLAESQRGELGTKRQIMALNRIMAEIDNFRAGWQWSVVHLNLAFIGHYAKCLKWLADSRSLYLEVLPEFEQAADRLRRVMEDKETPPALRRQIAYVLALVLHQQAFMCTRAVSVTQGFPLAAESLDLLRRTEFAQTDGSRQQEYMDALAWTIYVARMATEIDLATKWSNELLRLAEARPPAKGYKEMALLCLGYLAHDQGHYEEAEHLYSASKVLSGSEFDALLAQNPLSRLGKLYLDVGDLDRARDAIDQCERAVEQFGYRFATKDMLMIRAEIAMAQGKLEEADELLVQLKRMVDDTGDVHGRIIYLLSRAKLARHMQKPVEAQRIYREAVELTEHVGRRNYHVRALVGLGYATLEGESFDEAGTWFRRALDRAWRLGLIPQVLDAIVGLVAIYVQTHGWRDALDLLAIAVSHPACLAGTRRTVTRLLAQRTGAALADVGRLPSHPQPGAALEPLVESLLSLEEWAGSRAHGRCSIERR